MPEKTEKPTVEIKDLELKTFKVIELTSQGGALLKTSPHWKFIT